ncbi:MAG: hypothetical protein GY820_28235 [Gammaproteobacteria bacterium]|nr:hypothetical protein [Gammaproteobacteria bacterium]
MGQWIEPDLRDCVVDYIRYWSERSSITKLRIIAWIGIGKSKYHGWQKRYGKVNEHNAWIPRDHWLEAWEKQAILS